MSTHEEVLQLTTLFMTNPNFGKKICSCPKKCNKKEKTYLSYE
jgi:hypothetical protein